MKTKSERAIDRLNSHLIDPLDKRRRSFFIPKPPSGRRLVITDIHGCFQTFIKLLNKVDLKKRDQLFIIGDMVDRGPYSYMVLDKIWQLLDRGYQVYPLRGNHEQLFLSFNRENRRKLSVFASRQYASHLLEADERLNTEVDKFFGTLPIYYETDIAFLVHAGFNTLVKDPFKEWKDMMWIRSFGYDDKKLKNKMVVHGHVPTPYSTISKRIKQGRKLVNIDNGCIRAGVEDYGYLMCFNIDTHELIRQKNIDLLPV